MCICDSDIYLNDDDYMIQQKNVYVKENVYKLVEDKSYIENVHVMWKEDFVLILKFKILIKTEDGDDDDDDDFECVVCDNVNQKWSGKTWKRRKKYRGLILKDMPFPL